MWKDIVGLISVVTSQNEYKEVIETDGDKREVFADKKSVKRDEFYKAFSAGIELTAAFVVKKLDYNNETKLEHNGITYKVVRTYELNEEDIELNCSTLSTVGGSIG